MGINLKSWVCMNLVVEEILIGRHCIHTKDSVMLSSLGLMIKQVYIQGTSVPGYQNVKI